MTGLTRRVFAAALFATAAFATNISFAAEPLQELKIGFQKTGLTVVARQQRVIEKALEPKGIKVRWVEFTAGPPVVEALNVGSIDLGYVGDAPPIFGQSAGSAIVYVAALGPDGEGEAIIVKPGSPIQSLADLKGKKIGVAKGTSAHNLLIAALEKANVAYSDITPVFLSPADAAAAFASDKIEAWSIWDPFFAIAETRYDPRVLVRASDVLNVRNYLVANKDFAAAHPDVVTASVGALHQAADWANANKDKVAQALHEVTGVPLEAQTIAANRAVFLAEPVSPEIVARQQETADRFFKLKLIPNAVKVSDAVWTAPTN